MAKGGWQEFSRPESLQRSSGPAAEPTAKAQQRVRVQPQEQQRSQHHCSLVPFHEQEQLPWREEEA